MKSDDLIIFAKPDVISDRIVGAKLCNNSDVVEIMLFAYMPFYNHNVTQPELYVDTIDVLQSVVDQYGAVCPMQYKSRLSS